MKRKVVSVLVSIALMASMIVGCGNSGSNEADSAGTGTQSAEAESVDEEGAESVSTGEVDTSETVNLVMYLYGSDGIANEAVMEKLNEKLKADINTTLEVKRIDYADVSTKYPLLWASGEQFDMAYVASNAAMPYGTLAKQEALVDITDMLDQYVPDLKAALGDAALESMKIGGRIYGVPSTYSEYTAYGFISRKDLMDKYGISEISSIEDMEAYMDAALEDGWTPLNGNSNLAFDMYRMFLDTTDGWIEAPGLPTTDLYFAADKDNPGEIFSPVFTDEFEEFAVKMKEWADKGYWSRDVLSSSQDDKDNCYNGLSASFITHMPDWTGNYLTQTQKLPDVETEFYCFPEANGKIIRKMGCENATGISINSEYPERCLMVIEKLMTDEECYRLFQYGIDGVQYEVVDGVLQSPEGYNAETDAFKNTAWALRTDAQNLQQFSENPVRYTLNEEWGKVAIDNPFVGFTFDNSAVSAELSAISNVDSQLGIQILLGKTTQDPREAVATYREQLKSAGIDTVLDAANEQYQEYTAEK